VLELARSGAPVLGVVSFHGGLDTPNPADAKSIKAKVLALHGADDTFVPPQQVSAFQDEMRKANVDWQMVFYGARFTVSRTPIPVRTRSVAWPTMRGRQALWSI